MVVAVLALAPRDLLAETEEALPPLDTEVPADLDKSVPGKLEQVDAWLGQGNFEEAARAAVAALRQAQRDLQKDSSKTTMFRTAWRTLLKVADVAKQAGAYGIATHCFSQCKTVWPDASEPIIGLADTNRLAGRTWEAFRLYDDYMKIPANKRPQDERAHLGQGLVCLDLAQANLALYHLKKACEIAPNNAEARLGLARAQFMTKKFDNAVKSAERAVALDDQQPVDKRHPEYRYWLARIYNASGELEKGIEATRILNNTLRDQVKRNPTDRQLLRELEEGLALYAQLLRKHANTPSGRENAALYLEIASIIEAQGAIQQIHRYLDALDMLRGTREKLPQNIDILLAIGRFGRLVGDSETAIDAYQSVLKIASDHEQAKEALREMGAPLQPPAPTTSAAASAR